MDLSYVAVAILAVNLLVFLGGCTLAVYRTHAKSPDETALARLSIGGAHRGGK